MFDVRYSESKYFTENKHILVSGGVITPPET
jgi:hypothetical protein